MTRTLIAWTALMLFCHATEADYFRLLLPAPYESQLRQMHGDGTFMFSIEEGAVGSNVVVQRASSLSNDTVWLDYLHHPTTNKVMTLQVVSFDPPPGMINIPAGALLMGDTYFEYLADEVPVHEVYISAFYMDRYEVTKALWDEVHAWAVTNGYGFEDPANGKASNHPVTTVNWFDVVKWCNARSEREGLIPAYYTSTTFVVGHVYRQGEVRLSNTWVRWESGYRLPTEAEWEKAARGGPRGQRFPWHDSDEIQHDRANYYSITNHPLSLPFDSSATAGFHPDYAIGGAPYTSPVGSFAPNGYGLYDMAGNVWEWCWDWYDATYYTTSPSANPRGPATGTQRIARGGAWSAVAWQVRNARRSYGTNEFLEFNSYGFRCVRQP